MQKGAMSIEANIIEKRNRLRSEKRVTYKDDTTPSTSSSDRTDVGRDHEKDELT